MYFFVKFSHFINNGGVIINNNKVLYKENEDNDLLKNEIANEYGIRLSIVDNKSENNTYGDEIVNKIIKIENSNLNFQNNL